MRLTTVSLHNYFNRYLPALDVHSSTGVQLLIAQVKSAARPAKGSPEAQAADQADLRTWQRMAVHHVADFTRYTVSDDVLECVSLLRPVERRLALLAPEHRDTLRAYYTEPQEPGMVREWAWLERDGELPLAVMVMAARRLGVTLKQLTTWAKASGSAERMERGKGVARLRAEGSRMVKAAHDAWNSAGRAQPTERAREPVAAE